MGARTFAEAVPIEIAVADGDGRAWRAAENTILVIDELDVINNETTPVQTNTRPIHIGDSSAGQDEVSHRCVVTRDDKKPFTHTGLIRDYNTGCGPLDHQTVGTPHCAIKILTWSYLNVITVLGDLCGSRWCFIDLPRPYLEERGVAGNYPPKYASQYQQRRSSEYGGDSHGSLPSGPQWTKPTRKIEKRG